MSDSDGGHVSPNMTPETVQNETDDPDPRHTQSVACGVIGRRSIRA